MMLREERHHRICGLVGSLHRVSTDRIAGELGVSRETVRRDILDLEARGQLRRVHGGVVAPGPSPEPALTIRAQVRQQEKRLMAKAVLRILQPGFTLFIDAGSTVSILAEELARESGYTIVTNSFDVAMKIAGPGTQRSNAVEVIGGQFGSDVPATYGARAVREIGDYRADLAILSPVGIHHLRGATSFDLAEAEIARAMIGNADRVVILADHSKIGLSSRVTTCLPDRIDILVTDAKSQEARDYGVVAKSVGSVIVAARQ
jgi:DeoR/GlpR family transcriptional regulator of sugar metabolism